MVRRTIVEAAADVTIKGVVTTADRILVVKLAVTRILMATKIVLPSATKNVRVSVVITVTRVVHAIIAIVTATAIAIVRDVIIKSHLLAVTK